MAAKREEKKNI